MFINCRHCNALVATDPATDAPPERCPRCAGVLREAGPPPATSNAAATDDATPATQAADANADAEVSPAIEAIAAGPIDARAAAAPPPPVPSDDPDGAWRRAADLVAALGRRDAVRREDDARFEDPAIDAAEGDEDANAPPAALAAAADAVHAPTIDATDADTPAVPVSASASAQADDAPATDDADAGIDAHPADAHDAPEARETAAARPVDAVPARQVKAAPSFAAARHPPRPQAHRRGWHAPAAIAALCGLLLLQILLADRARLAEDARWRPLLTTLCGALGCSLPPWREPDAIRLVTRDVRAHPARPGVLRATATLRNDARWPQAWPRVVLTLSDIDGRTIGMRDFAPHEYLGETPTEDTLSSGQSALIRLDVVEPAANVVAFSFDFH